MTNATRNLHKQERWLLAAMLALLHAALWLGLDSPWARSLLFIHLGFFLLWQPLWRSERELPLTGIASIILACIAALWWLNWWLLAVWISCLFALTGGRVFAAHARRQRIQYLLIMGYLLTAQLAWVMPQLFAPQALTSLTTIIMKGLLPLLLVAAAVTPIEPEAVITRRTVDFIYSLLLFLLLMILMLGSLAFMTIARLDYLSALLRTLFSLAGMLFALGWLWNPRFGFGGLQSLFSRYLLNVGTPFEGWLRQLDATSRLEPEPQAFLVRAAEHLAALPWVAGMQWQASGREGRLHAISPHALVVTEGELRLTLYCKQYISPALRVHIQLLIHLLGHFYQAKLHEQRLREMTRLHAIHETGARLTHDLKNMLQSLFGLISIAQHDGAESVPALRQQLPVLAQRIELLMDKLKVPQDAEQVAMLPLAAWWENLQQRHLHTGISWSFDGTPGETPIPAALFDSVTDNLIDNALLKQQREPGIRIRLHLQTAPIRLIVCDSGSAIPANRAGQLLHSMVPSEHGLGIGLFQAARWAAQLNYRLELQDNRDGNVCFALAPH